MPVLKALTIAFVTHGAPPSFPPLANPKIHVFVKNRSSDTSQPERSNDFAANRAGFQRYEAKEPAAVPHEINPYLGHAVALGAIPFQTSLLGGGRSRIILRIHLTSPCAQGQSRSKKSCSR